MVLPALDTPLRITTLQSPAMAACCPIRPTRGASQSAPGRRVSRPGAARRWRAGGPAERAGRRPGWRSDEPDRDGRDGEEGRGRIRQRADRVGEGPEHHRPADQSQRHTEHEGRSREHGGLPVHGAPDPGWVRPQGSQHRHIATAALDRHEERVDQGEERQDAEEEGEDGRDPAHPGEGRDRRGRILLSGCLSRSVPSRSPVSAGAPSRGVGASTPTRFALDRDRCGGWE